MFELIRDDLQLFEARLARELESDVEFIQRIATDLVAAGGKRLRPSLAFLAARLLGADREHGQQVAVTVELLHSASLLHDDLIDGAEVRRGKEAAFRRYGNVVSTMSGDYILARVLRLLARIDNADFTLLVSDTAARVCEGEVLQYEMAALESYSLDGYRRVIEGKTAELIAASLEGVAVLAGAPARYRDALRSFGMRYGRAFQMQDDYLDLLGDEGGLGKPTGGDLREGKVTYPVLLLLERGVEEAREIVRRRAAEPGDPLQMAKLVRLHGVDTLTRDRITAESRAAIEALSILPDGPALEALSSLAEQELERAT
ncbi:MAG TPA: polyprenyl synthetase family protein [Trueperaceae bacterium]